MQTYTESQGHKPFNWRMSLISRIRHNSPILKELMRKSNSWIDCPCGNLDNRIPRSSMNVGQPKDNLLAIYGFNFNSAIESGKWKKALKILNKIEKRALKILSKIS